jgi:hypothetical protein
MPARNAIYVRPACFQEGLEEAKNRPYIAGEKEVRMVAWIKETARRLAQACRRLMPHKS